MIPSMSNIKQFILLEIQKKGIVYIAYAYPCLQSWLMCLFRYYFTVNIILCHCLLPHYFDALLNWKFIWLTCDIVGFWMNLFSWRFQNCCLIKISSMLGWYFFWMYWRDPCLLKVSLLILILESHGVGGRSRNGQSIF